MQFKAYLIGFGVALAALAGVYGMVWFSRDGAHEFRGERLRFAAEVPLAVLPGTGGETPSPSKKTGGERGSVKRKASTRSRSSRAATSLPALTGTPPASGSPPPAASGPSFSPAVPAPSESIRESAAPPREPCAFVTNEMPRHTRVIINEVAWMGSVVSPNAEWIELKSISLTAVDLNGWELVDQGEQIRVRFGNADGIAAGGFYLLERSSDDAVPAVAADKVYSGALANEGEGIRLFASDCGLEDEVFANLDWPGGENESKRTMERDHSWFGWHTASAIGGTPGAENSPAYVKPQAPPPQPPPSTSAPIPSPTPQPTGGPSPTPTPSATPTPTGTPASSPQPSPASNANHVLIDEVQVAGADAGDEFVELYNPTDAAVDLSGWSVQYVSGSATSTRTADKKNFVDGNVIPAHGFFLIARARNPSGTDGYTGVVAADLPHRSIRMSGDAAGAKVFLVNDQREIESFTDPNIVDMLDYSFAVPPAGQSVERKAWQGSCVSAQGAGVLFGNGCDTDVADDWEVRPSSEPQNNQSNVEP